MEKSKYENRFTKTTYPPNWENATRKEIYSKLGKEMMKGFKELSKKRK